MKAVRAFSPIAALALAGWTCARSPTTAPEPSAAPPATTAPALGPAAAAGCQLAAMSDHGNCPRGSPLFEAQVERAIEEVISIHPEVFDLTKTRGCDRCFLVLNPPAYERLVEDRLKRMGFCVKCDEECGVKNTNAFNEQYDILLSNLFMRRSGSGAYRATCFPAAF